MGGHHRSILILDFFHFLAIFGHFLAVFASAWPSLAYIVVLSDFVLLSTYLYLKPGLGGFWGGLRGGLGGWGVLGGRRGGQEGSAWPLKGTFCPSGSLIQDQIWFQTPHNGATGQYLQDQYHWPVFGPFGALPGAPKGQFHCQTSHFEAPNSPQSGLLSPEMIISWPIIPEWIILDYIWSI